MLCRETLLPALDEEGMPPVLGPAELLVRFCAAVEVSMLGGFGVW